MEIELEICLTQASSETIPIKNEVNIPNTPIKVKTPYSKMKESRRQNTGIQVTILNSCPPRVIHVSALPREKLPPAYLRSSFPHIWCYKDKLIAGDGYILLEAGIQYSREDVTKALHYIQMAGEHLAMVNRGLKWSWPMDSTITFKDGKFKYFSVDKKGE